MPKNLLVEQDQHVTPEQRRDAKALTRRSASRSPPARRPDRAAGRKGSRLAGDSAEKLSTLSRCRRDPDRARASRAARLRRSAWTDDKARQHPRQRHHGAARRGRIPLDRVERQRADRASTSPLRVAAQRGQMRADAEPLAEVVRQRADVEAGGAVDAERDRVRRRPQSDRARWCSRRTGAGRAGAAGRAGSGARRSLRPSRRAIASLAADLLRRERRRLLQERAAERVERAIDRVARRPARPDDAGPTGRPCRVLRVGRDAEPDDRFVGLVARAQEPGEPRRAADDQRQHAGRAPDRACRCGRCAARRARAARARRRRARSGPTGLSMTRAIDGRLVHRRSAVDRRSIFSTNVFCSASIGPVTVQPAAFLWPPPPNSFATAPMSMSPFERMLTRYSSPSACLKKTTAWISFTVSGRLISPSVSS